MNARNWTDELSGALHFEADIDELRLIGLDSTAAGTYAGQVMAHLPWLQAPRRRWCFCIITYFKAASC